QVAEIRPYRRLVALLGRGADGMLQAEKRGEARAPPEHPPRLPLYFRLGRPDLPRLQLAEPGDELLEVHLTGVALSILVGDLPLPPLDLRGELQELGLLRLRVGHVVEENPEGARRVARNHHLRIVPAPLEEDLVLLLANLERLPLLPPFEHARHRRLSPAVELLRLVAQVPHDADDGLVDPVPHGGDRVADRLCDPA